MPGILAGARLSSDFARNCQPHAFAPRGFDTLVVRGGFGQSMAQIQAAPAACFGDNCGAAAILSLTPGAYFPMITLEVRRYQELILSICCCQ
jgi:hypothetical protein